MSIPLYLVTVSLIVTLVRTQDNLDVRLFCKDLPEEQVTCGEELEQRFNKATEAYKVCSDKTAAPCCRANRTILVECIPKEDVVCIGDRGIPEDWKGNVSHHKELPCRYVTGYDYRTALILSVFMGMFGIDRFYLGYYAIGLLKFCTFGFFLLGQLVDIILIATQTVGPADGSDYLISVYGPILNKVGMENHTFYQYGSYYFKQLQHDEF